MKTYILWHPTRADSGARLVRVYGRMAGYGLLPALAIHPEAVSSIPATLSSVPRYIMPSWSAFPHLTPNADAARGLLANALRADGERGGVAIFDDDLEGLIYFNADGKRRKAPSEYIQRVFACMERAWEADSEVIFSPEVEYALARKTPADMKGMFSTRAPISCWIVNLATPYPESPDVPYRSAYGDHLCGRHSGRICLRFRGLGAAWLPSHSTILEPSLAAARVGDFLNKGGKVLDPALPENYHAFIYSGHLRPDNGAMFASVRHKLTGNPALLAALREFPHHPHHPGLIIPS